ncbi:MAG: MogA/MoaB family molybdenum cofactor biosynthesis protein [Eggerthellaceae bacterium]|nr:MogA/MoaB family molybdenum cofactor biosynthesis protein [Eggerthellaceae bacterium]
MDIWFGIVTASDTRGFEQDTAGEALEALIAEQGWKLRERVVVKDERASISAAIVKMADEYGVDVVLTCGGTGLSLRDVTPEATQDVCDRNVPGIAEAMRSYSLTKTGRAMLSRAVVMQRGTTLVINLPGSEKAARENWEAVCDQLEHAVLMTAGGGH